MSEWNFTHFNDNAHLALCTQGFLKRLSQLNWQSCGPALPRPARPGQMDKLTLSTTLGETLDRQTQKHEC